MFETIFTEIQKDYGSAKGNLERSLARFNDSLWDADLLIGIS